MSTLDVTVVVPVRNEAGRLEECIRSVIGFARAVVVVDSASDDRTPDIGVSAGATVLQFKWDGGNEKKRNWVLRTHSFSTAWVLFLDADERMTPEAWAALEPLLDSGVDGFEFTFFNHFAGKRLRWGDPQRKVAMVRKGKGRYEVLPESGWSTLDMEVHEHLLVDGPVTRIRTPLLHLDDRGVDHLFRKHLEYAAWESRRVAAGGTASLGLKQRIKYRVMKSLWFPFAYFFYAYVLRGGFLDGGAGLLYGLAKLSYFLQVAIRVRTGEE